MTKRILIAGGTGLIGKALRKSALRRGWHVDILSRKEGEGLIRWNPEKGVIQLSDASRYDAILNLAGSSIAGKRWTSSRKLDIVESRVNSARTIAAYLRSGQLQTPLYVGASATGYYGNRAQDLADDWTDHGSSRHFMVSTTLQWEAAHAQVDAFVERSVIFRAGLVLSREGGALYEIVKTAPIGFIAYFGKGEQYWSWIHIDDLVEILLESVADQTYQGTYLAVAPNPVQSKTLSRVLSKTFPVRRMSLPVPGILLRLLFGEMSSVLLQSVKGVPSRLLQKGYFFRFSTIDEALRDLIQPLENVNQD